MDFITLQSVLQDGEAMAFPVDGLAEHPQADELLRTMNSFIHNKLGWLRTYKGMVVFELSPAGLEHMRAHIGANSPDQN